MAKLGKYELLAEVGRGGMGVVYRALDPLIGRPVAIKVVRFSDFADPEERSAMQQRLLREARSAGILSHAGIVTIYDVAREGDVAYIVMEFVNGPSLDRVLSWTIPPSKDFVLSVIRQTAAALDYAHKRGIVHRDIKPSNLMIADGTTPKIADFGLAKIASSPKMTQTGTAIGTPYYMAPEQVQGFPVDARTDQYGLVVVAYQMLTGARPFSAESISTLFFKIVYAEPMPAGEINPTIGAPIEAVLRKGLSKAPGDRYGSCTEFAGALEEACRQTPGWMPRPGVAASRAADSVHTGSTPAPGNIPGGSETPAPAPSPLSYGPSPLGEGPSRSSAIRRIEQRVKALTPAQRYLGLAALTVMLGLALFLALSGGDGGGAAARPPSAAAPTVTPVAPPPAVVTPPAKAEVKPAAEPKKPRRARKGTSAPPAAPEEVKPDVTVEPIEGTTVPVRKKKPGGP